MAHFTRQALGWVNRHPRLRQMLTRMVFGNRDLDVSIFGLQFRINSLKENGYYRASGFCRKSSLLRDEVSVLCTLSSLLRRDTIFIDAGANIGLFSSMIARLAPLYPGMSVMAFEVDPLTYDRLAVNSRAYGFEALNFGLSDQKAEGVSFVRGAASGVTSQSHNVYSLRANTFEARLERLDDLDLPQDKGLVLKIDVEDHELEVIRGAQALLEAGRIRAIFADGVKEYDATIAYLKNYGFHFVDAGLPGSDKLTSDLLAIHESADYGRPRSDRIAV